MALGSDTSIVPQEKSGSGKMPDSDLSKIESCAVGELQLIEQAETKRNIKSRHAQYVSLFLFNAIF